MAYLRYAFQVVVIHDILYLVMCQIPYVAAKMMTGHDCGTIFCSDRAFPANNLFADTRPGAMRGPLCLLL